MWLYYDRIKLWKIKANLFISCNIFNTDLDIVKRTFEWIIIDLTFTWSSRLNSSLSTFSHFFLFVRAIKCSDAKNKMIPIMLQNIRSHAIQKSSMDKTNNVDVTWSVKISFHRLNTLFNQIKRKILSSPSHQAHILNRLNPKRNYFLKYFSLKIPFYFIV